MYTETLAKLRYKNFLQAAIFLVLIFPTGSYTQIKWAGTVVDDFLDTTNSSLEPATSPLTSPGVYIFNL